MTTPKEDSGYLDLRDSYVPLFTGQPADYREWRQRIQIYHRKMSLSKRANESVLNIVGSFRGVVWRLFEDWSLEKFEQDDSFEKVLEVLDGNFAYDQRVQLPNDFENYFNLLQRAPGQTLLAFVNEHEEAYRRLLQHKVALPDSVQGWHLLRRCALSKEQRQLLMLKAPTLEKQQVIEALYLILGQDYKAGGWNHERNKRFQRWPNRAYAAQDDWDEDPEDQWAEEETGYYEDDEWGHGDSYEDDPTFDDEAGYFGDEPWPESSNETASPEQLADEFDSAYASYTDARKRFNDLKMSRGFLPVVALADQQTPMPTGATASASTSSPTSWQRKGKGKGGKSKGKNKSNTIRYPPSTGGKSDPKGRARANMTCLRCGQQGHWAANCPQNSSPKSSGTKRPAPTEGMALLSMSEDAMIIFQDHTGAERPECVMLDPGASAFLSGYGPFRRYLQHLRQDCGFPLDQIMLTKGKRRFQFGGDAASWSTWSVHLPVFLDGRYGTIQMFLLPGNTPMLCGRPIIEALGMTMDFAMRRICIGSSGWQEATLGRQGEYLLSLTADHDFIQYEPQNPDFSLKTADADMEQVDGFHLTDFEQAEHGFAALSTLKDEEIKEEQLSNTLRQHSLQTMDIQLRTHLNDISAYLTRQLHGREGDQKRVLWEVYCGSARTSQVAESLGMSVRRFGLDTGWNFELLAHQAEFLRLQEEELPDEVLLAPECKLWSRMQTLARRTVHQQEALIAARQHHHDRHLVFVRKVYMNQVSGGRHGHIEQPKHALSWSTRALRDLPGYRADFDQCRYGATCLDEDSQWRPVKKSTTLLTTKKAMQNAMTLTCRGDHDHCALEGSASGYGPRTRYLEDYQPALASTLASAILLDEPPQFWEAGYASNEQRTVTSNLVKLRSDTRQQAIRIVQKLHRNLGHPSTKELTELLQTRGASEEVLKAAQSYVCAACAKYKKPAEASPASLPQSTTFNQQLQADIFWLRRGTIKYAILSVVDTATRYTAARLVNSEQSTELIKALERGWIAHFGPPQQQVTDEGRAWLGHDFENWTSVHGVEHIVAPGEAHERLAIVERRHAVLRKAVEIYLDDLKLDHADGIREALTYCIPQLNSSPSVAGFSPSQWVLGYQPELAGSLLSTSNFRASHVGGHPRFEETLSKRAAAQKALIDADADRRLRRALGAKYKGLNSEYQMGQQVWFWRGAKQPDLVKIRWLGPAHIVMKEYNLLVLSWEQKSKGI